MRIISLALFVFINLFTITYSLPAYADGLALYQSQTVAQNSCPNDIVVWLNLPTGIWHFQGSRWYGKTKHGAFVCEKEAAAAGDRASLNG